MRLRSHGVRLVLSFGASLVLAACVPRTPPVTGVPRSTTTAAVATPRAPTPSATLAVPTATESVIPTTTPTLALPAASPRTVQEVRVYLVRMGGGTVGCGDQLVPVTRPVAPTTNPLTAALRELLSVKTRIDSRTGLYNALYQSRLSVNQVQLVNGKATILLTGQLVMGGECDSPRVEAQLKQTALQFPTVKEVSIFIDGTPIEKIVSLR